MKGNYNGDESHIVKAQAYNWVTEEYLDLFTQDMSLYAEERITNLPHSNEYFQGGRLKIRFIHTNSGNPGHLLRFNYFVIDQGSLSSSSSSSSSS